MCEERLKEINEAYSVLGDPEKKEAYDAEPQTWVKPRMRAPEGFRGAEVFRRTFQSPLERLMAWVDEEPFWNVFFSRERPWEFRPEPPSLGSFPGKRSAGVKGPSVEVHIQLPASHTQGGQERVISYRVGNRVEEVPVRIPPGVREGTRLRMAGRGLQSPSGGPPGDLVVVVHILPDA